MSGFINRVKTVDTVNPAGGVDPAKTPNVGQYGWTSYDASNVNQIIQYVDLCKKYAEVAAGSAEFIEAKYVELEKFMKYIEQMYETIDPIYSDIEHIHRDIINRHEDVKIRHEDIITRHDEIQTWHYEVNVMTEETEANAAKALTSQLLAGQSEQGAEDWYNKSYELYDDLRKGNIYRGTWNPHTGSYPNNGGTNSTWDVILNEGETEFRWNNILWFWGDRLVYLKEEDKYQQIESGTTVTSINGKKGAVVLSAEDVQAVPITRTVNGKALSANISITSTDTNSVPTTRRVNNKVLDSDVVLTHSDVQAVPLDRKINNKLLSADITLSAGDIGAVSSATYSSDLNAISVTGIYKLFTGVSNTPAGSSGLGDHVIHQEWDTNAKVQIYSNYTTGVLYTRKKYGATWSPWVALYSAGNKPTAADVGALPITGGTLTSPLIVKGTAYQALTLDSTDVAGCVIKGRKDGVDDWYIGRGNSAGDVVLHSYKHSTSLVMKSDSINFNRDLYVNTNKVYHQGFKPTTADVMGLDEALKNAGGAPILSAAWVQLRTAMWNGYIAADGQLLKRADYPDAWAAVKNRKVPVIAEADWTKEPQYRGFFTEGDGSSTFRIPDYNGKYAGSLGATFLRGDGLNAGKYNGSIQGDAIRNITGNIYNVSGRGIGSGLDVTGDGSFSSATKSPVMYRSGTDVPIDGFTVKFNASAVVPTAADNHPVNVTGCWAIKLFGAVQNAGEIDAATLATQLAEAQSKIALSEAKIAALESRRITQVVDVLWEGFATVADVLLHLSQPLVAGDMLTVEHNDNAKLTTAVVSLIPGKMVAEQVLYFPFSSTATTSLKYVDENTLKTSIFTTGYAISKVYRTRYALV